MAAVLTSWKEIASYLGKGVRTVQRWEGELGLPIRRPKPKSKQIVLAYSDELDNWVRQGNRSSSAADASRGIREAAAKEFARMRMLVSQMVEQIRITRQRTAELTRSLECNRANFRHRNGSKKIA